MKTNIKKLALLVLSSSMFITACGGKDPIIIDTSSSGDISSIVSSSDSGLSSDAGSSLSSTGGNSSSITPAGKTYTYNTYLETKPKTWNTHNWESSDESYIPAFTEMGFYDLKLNGAKDGYEFVTEMAENYPKDVSSEVTDEELDRYGYLGNIGSKGYVWDIDLNQNAKWEDGTAITADDYIESMKLQLDPKRVNFRADSYYSSSIVIANAEKYFKQGRQTIEEVYSDINLTTGDLDEEVYFSGTFYINIAKYTSYTASVFSNADNETTLYTVLNNRSSSASNAVELAAQRITDAVTYYCWKYENHEGDYKSDWDEIEGYSKLSSVKEAMLNYMIDIDEFDEQRVLVRTTKDDSSEEHTEVYSRKKLENDLNTVVNGLGRGGAKSFAWKFPLFSDKLNKFSQPWGDEDPAVNPQALESGVGLVKMGKYKIRLYLAQAITELDLKFSLSSNWLVKVDLYKKLDINTGGLISTQYATPGTGVAGYCSYGPYKLTAMEPGKSFKMERNDQWYGYKDGKHVGQFQLDAVFTNIIEKHETAVQEFEAGRLDDLSLNRADMKKYGMSSRLTRTYESYTQKISFNSNRDKLLAAQKSSGNNVNKTIVANTDFRKGLSLAMDRNKFASNATAGSKAFTGLLNDLYLTDVETGEMYRKTPQGKSVYAKVYGELGGNPYSTSYDPTKPVALEERNNGFNLNMATWYVATALEAELASTAEGHIKANDTIKLEFRVYDNESETTIEMLNFIEGQWKEVISAAVKKLQDKKVLAANQTISFAFDSIKDEDYYNTAKKGNYDLIFSTWGGAAINPIGLMQVYCDSTFDSCCEYGFAGKQDKAYIEIDANGDGKIAENESKSVNAWWTEASTNAETADRVTEYDEWNTTHQRNLNILAGLEAAILNRWEAIPLVARATSSLNGYRIENGSDTYINLIGYGGIRHLKITMDDAAWDAFVKAQGGNLSDLYKN
ncbi:MAG: ABC transporter substrate-binding protein [Bacilli bacterium]|nr:ABC transporter substrate-binding protein [Bacilli bacterium]